ncbi:NACHT domain-containing protein [Micromonospora sagamiensis]|nr:hypothetical protein GCM10017556_47750 [Micromonospora sagamiensis]
MMWILVRAVAADGPEEFKRWGEWAAILAALSGSLGIIIQVWGKRARRVDPPVVDEDRIGRAVADLAGRIRRDWAEEAVRREVTRPAPVLVRWSSTGRPAAARQFVVDDQLGGEWHHFPLSGKTDEPNNDSNDIVAAFRSLPHRQLMVLGKPGAGKTVFAMLLTLGLIRRPAAGEPVPVLLSIHLWDAAELLDDFVACRLAEDYGDVLAAHGDPLAVARRLVEDQRVLPVLDGLDELPADAVAEAMDRLDLFAAAGRPLVVTCRGDEYEEAVARSRVLSRAAVVELASVEVEDAITYLSQPVPDPRWEPVFAHLRAHQDGPLAKALSTPLMVALARSTYQAGSTADPVDLLDVAQTAAGQRAVEARLMADFVPAVYAPRPRRLASDQSQAGVHYHPEKAQRWLTFLARHMSEHGVQDVGWWELSPLIRTVFVTLAGLLVTLMTALLFVPVFGPVFGLAVTAVAGLVTVVVVVQTGGPPQSIHAEETTPRSALSTERARAISRGVGGGALIGVAIGLLLAILLGLGIGYAVLLVAVLGGAYTLATALDHPWGSFLVARFWLGVTGRLPFGLPRFLEDAHRRGVLRQSGARYQFRHLILQEHLAGGASPLTAEPPSVTLAPQQADGHRPKQHQQRVRLCVASVGLAFLGLFVLSTGEWAPNYRSGDRPETIMDVSCGGAGGSPSCVEYVAGYQWPVGPGGRVDTTFTFPNRQRVIQFQGMGGEFRLLPSNDCANAVLRWQISIDGQLWRSGEVHATTGRLDTPRAAPQQAKTVVVSARRVDTEPCAAVLHWDRPTGQYRGVTSGFGPWG